MTYQEKELIISRIAAACYPCKVMGNNGQTVHLLLKSPTRFHRYMAQQIYENELRDFELHSSFTDDELLGFLVDRSIWDEDKQAKLDDLQKNIEQFKVGMYQAYTQFKSATLEMGRKGLVQTKQEIAGLLELRNSYNQVSASGAAGMAKARYLIAYSLYYLDGRAFHKDGDFWQLTDKLLEEVVGETIKYKLTEEQVREIARSEPWRSTWTCRKSEGSLFGVPAIDLTEEQRILTVWSSIYDSIYEHPECPPDFVVNDDDILDGWMIVQKRKRESGANEGSDELIQNEKIRNSEEIFLVAETPEDVKRIESLNSDHAKILKRKREQHLRSKGVVHEAEMPDSKLEIQAQLTRMYVDSMKGT
jgi:hypothetical protein